MSQHRRPSDDLAPIDRHDPRVVAAIARYWRRNVTIMVVLLCIWAGAGLGCGVLFADWLDQFHLGGFPLGFWFAQQGSIVIFVMLILIYATALNVLDRQHHAELHRIQQQGLPTGGQAS